MVSDAYRFLLPLLLGSVLVGFYSPVAAAILIVIAGFIGYFFRNPKRLIPQGENLVVSPADGKVVRIFNLPERGDQAGGQGISVFLNIFDVHVNRSPIEGKLESFEYKRGRFKAAFDEEASYVNEQNVLTIRGHDMQVVVKQIAGLIARRVICWKKPGDSIERGELIGLIRFGSRVDILLPRQVRILVKTGDRVRGGSSVLVEYQAI